MKIIFALKNFCLYDYFLMWIHKYVDASSDCFNSHGIITDWARNPGHFVAFLAFVMISKLYNPIPILIPLLSLKGLYINFTKFDHKLYWNPGSHFYLFI